MTKENVNVFIDAWINGDEESYTNIFDYYYPRLLSAALNLVKNTDDAEELVMNVLLKVWQLKNRIQDIRDLDTYLFGILRQEISGLSRKKILLTETIDGIPLQNLGSVDHPEFSLRDLQLQYQAALNKLTPKQREVFLLSRDEQMSQQEIADHTGLSVNTINNHITSSLKIIRKELQSYPDAVVVVLITSSAALLLS
ncbi:MAG: sigma-70 family RNA polymerase sigma factor [Mucilaginibacter sp.]|uniref:RNA polymerase sigma factor n=1 Tax=Mucilaginibacter sp. TaxID=1882438 RepID=UPI0031A26287